MHTIQIQQQEEINELSMNLSMKEKKNAKVEDDKRQLLMVRYNMLFYTKLCYMDNNMTHHVMHNLTKKIKAVNIMIMYLIYVSS